MTLNESSLCKVPRARPLFHNMEKISHPWLKFSSLGPQPSLIQNYAFLANDLRPSDPGPRSHDPIIYYSGVLMDWVWMLRLQSHWSCYGGNSLSSGLPILFCCPALWIQGSQSEGKHQSSDMAVSGYVPPRDLSSTTHSNPSPNSYQKFPWWEMLLWEGVPALWLTLFH